jgi:hypothetical protein
MSLGVGSDKDGWVVSQRRVLRVTGEDAVGSSDAERFRDDADVVDSMESDLCRLRPSAEGRRGDWEGAEEFEGICMVKEGVSGHRKDSSTPWAIPIFPRSSTRELAQNSSLPTHRRPSWVGTPLLYYRSPSHLGLDS